MKKKILYIAAIMICLSIITSGTLAYFTSEDTARNVITSGGVLVEVVEQQMTDNGLEAYPGGAIKIMPGTEVSKIVTVRSDEQAAWVRMTYHIDVFDPTGKEMEVPEAELEQMILISPDTENWTEKDGWWYYGSQLKDGESSTPLFETVTFSGPNMGNEYQNCTIEIIVTAQAVQSAHNGSTVMDAGWTEN